MKKKLLHLLMMGSKQFMYILLIQVMTITMLSATDIAAQRIKSVKEIDIKLHVENSPLTDVFKAIEQKTDFHFSYDEKTINSRLPFTYQKSGTVADVLMAISKAGGLRFKQINENIHVQVMSGTDKDEVEIITVVDKVSGVVRDIETGETLPGVNIIVKGTMIGTTSDIDGRYQLDIPETAENPILVYSFIGYKNQEVAVNNRNVIDISMSQDVSQLQEFVLTGYQTLSADRATGSFETLSPDQIEKPASSIAERLVGMVAGLQATVNTDGTIDFEIRGQSSLFISKAERQPLIVYDGFPIEGGFASINPNDVESITVLKDAAAASIWGAKSANGVIVITSKKAKKGEMKVTVSSFVKIADKIDLDYVNPIAPTNDVIEYEQQAFDSDFFGGPWPPPSASVSSLGAYSQAVTAMNEVRLGRMDASERDAILARLRTQNNKSQIEDHLLQAPITQQYNLAISGAGERSANKLTLMYEDNQRYYKGDDNNKLLANYNNKTKVTEWLDFEFSGMVQYNKFTNNGVDLGFIKGLQPYDMLLNDDGSLADMSYLNYYMPNFNEFVPADQFPYADWSYNPITEINNRDLVSAHLNTRIQTGLTFNIIEGLSVASRIQYELFTSSTKDYYSDKTFEVRQFVNETSGWNKDFNTAPTQNLPSGGVLQQNNCKGLQFQKSVEF